MCSGTADNHYINCFLYIKKNTILIQQPFHEYVNWIWCYIVVIKLTVNGIVYLYIH